MFRRSSTNLTILFIMSGRERGGIQRKVREEEGGNRAEAEAPVHKISP